MLANRSATINIGNLSDSALVHILGRIAGTRSKSLPNPDNSCIIRAKKIRGASLLFEPPMRNNVNSDNNTK